MMLSAQCIHCLTESNFRRVRDLPDEARDGYMRALVRILADAAERDTPPAVVARIHRLRSGMLGMADDFEAVKRRFNRLMLDEAPALRARIESSPDPLAEAMRIAMAGNYIDFGSVEDVNSEKLAELLAPSARDDLPPEEYRSFRQDLAGAKRLAYLTDNCGEIVLDRLLIETILQRYPGIQVTAVVRGAPVANDATAEDALEVGLDRVAKIVSNGTRIGGTQLDAILEDARQAIEEADLVISKGQGNFETLSGSGLNIYYLFLCKCRMFTDRFGMPLYQGVFANDLRLDDRLKA